MAAVAAPIALGVLDGEVDEDLDESDNETGESAPSDLLDPQSEDHIIQPGSGETVLSDFEPGVDKVRLLVDSWDIDFEIGVNNAGSSTISYPSGEGAASVTFEGLSALPMADIDIEVTDPETGEVSVISLLDSAAEPEGPAPIGPTDPDAPEDEPPAPVDDVVPIGPPDPDAPDDAPVVPLEDAEPIAPLDPDAPEDALGGVTQTFVSDDDMNPADDAAWFGNGGVMAESAAGAPASELAADEILTNRGVVGPYDGHLALKGPGDAILAAEVFDFDPGADVLQIAIDLPAGGPEPAIEVQATSDESASAVLVDGQIMALLHGALGVTAQDILLVPLNP